MLNFKGAKWKKKFLATILAYVGKYLIRLIFFTCKVSVQGLESFTDCAGKKKCILVLWHNRLSLVAEILHIYAPQFFYAAIISKSRDGEALAILANSYSCGRVIRVPHDARHVALKNLTERLNSKEEIIIMTPDGPRGPCYEVKPGIVWAAQAAEAMVIPFTWKANSYWELNTWDKFRLPKPFTKIDITFGIPMKFDKAESLNSTKLQDHIKLALDDLA